MRPSGERRAAEPPRAAATPRPPSLGRRSPFPKDSHDHKACVDTAIAGAQAYCEHRRQRLTPMRKRVLEMVWHSHKPVGAYALLDGLLEEGHRAAPTTVYRALDFLLGLGLVHRIASLNAFVGCPQPGQPHTGQFLICEACGSAEEIDDDGIAQAVRRGAERIGFRVQHPTIEITGRCPRCR